jgi:phosphate transport system substrate-binding protein
MVSEGLTPTAAVATATPVSAPGATYSHDASIAPTSDRTMQAQAQLARARAQSQVAADAQAASGPQPTTAAAISGTPFAGKPTGDVLAAAPAGASTAAVVASADQILASAPANPSLKKAETAAPSNPVLISANGTVTPMTPPPAAANAGGNYTVSKGDTLSSIARRNSVSVSDLRKWNGLKGDTLRVGQVLKLSGSQ